MPLFSPYFALFRAKKSIFHTTTVQPVPYNAIFEVEKDDVGRGKACFFNCNIVESIT